MDFEDFNLTDDFEKQLLDHMVQSEKLLSNLKAAQDLEDGKRACDKRKKQPVPTTYKSYSMNTLYAKETSETLLRADFPNFGSFWYEVEFEMGDMFFLVSTSTNVKQCDDLYIPLNQQLQSFSGLENNDSSKCCLREGEAIQEGSRSPVLYRKKRKVRRKSRESFQAMTCELNNTNKFVYPSEMFCTKNLESNAADSLETFKLLPHVLTTNVNSSSGGETEQQTVNIIEDYKRNTAECEPVHPRERSCDFPNDYIKRRSSGFSAPLQALTNTSLQSFDTNEAIQDISVNGKRETTCIEADSPENVIRSKSTVSVNTNVKDTRTCLGGSCKIPSGDTKSSPTDPATARFRTDRVGSLSCTVGFTTAGFKPLKCSEESISKAKKLLENINDVHEDLSRNQDSRLSGSSKALLQVSGFKTASNKHLSVSAKAMKNAQSFFADIKDENGSDLLRSTSCFNKLHDIKTAVNAPDISKQSSASDDSCKYPEYPVTSSENVVCTGFKTASNKSMSVSTMSWKKGQSFINSEDNVKGSDAPSNYLLNVPTISDTSTCKKTMSKPRQEQRRSLPCTKSASPCPNITVAKAKRRNSVYKPPRKRQPLHDVQTNLYPPKKHFRGPKQSTSQDTSNVVQSNNESSLNRKHLGIRQEQESQIFISDESLLKAVALFEQT